MSPKKETKKTATKSTGWTDDEKAAMRERAKEMKAEARASKDRDAGVKTILAAMNALPEPDRAMAKRLYEIVTTNAPALMPKTWYGMPAYANAEGKVVCFFTPASKFNARYATFGFNDSANLDEGNMWMTSFALVKLTSAEEAKIAALVKKAVR
jgi:uncharacterized protein YdhG (YjbR/CyaY superfamily)